MSKNLNSEIKYKVKVDEKCPCGSNNSFEQCCKGKNYEYNTLGKNFNGDEIVYNQTENMEIYDDITNYAMENIFLYNGEGTLTVSKGLENLKEVYKKVDKGIKPFERYAPCQRGCGSCCNLYLECTPVEAELIRKHILSTREKEEIERLNLVIKEKLEKLTPKLNSHELKEEEKREQWLKYAEKKEKCIFLNEENACSIYEVRPLSCRKFIVFSEAEKCNTVSEIVTPNLAPANIARLSIDYLSLSVARYNKLNYVSENGEVVPIMRCLIQWFKNGFNDINRDLGITKK